MTRALFVDWENVWIAVRQNGYSVRPVDLLESLVAAAFPDPTSAISVYVACNMHFPTGLEAAQIYAWARSSIDTTVTIERVTSAVPGKKNVADTTLAFRVGIAVNRGELTSLAIASADSDLATLAMLAAQRSALTGSVRLVYVLPPRQKPIRARGIELIDQLRATTVPLPEPVAVPRPATGADIAAWTLALAFTNGRRDAEAAALHMDRRGKEGRPSWWPGSKTIVDLDMLSDVDEVWWHVQQLQVPHLVLTPAEAVPELVRRAPDRLKGRVPAALDGLLAADLVRVDRDGNIVYDPTAREALLMPIRRAVLHLLANPTLTDNQLKNLHVKARFPKVPASEAGASWSRVMEAMTAWGCVKRRGTRPPKLNENNSVVTATEANARLIMNVLGRDPAAGLTVAQISSRVGPWVSKRWMRIMTQVHLAQHLPPTQTYILGDRTLP